MTEAAEIERETTNADAPFVRPDVAMMLAMIMMMMTML